MSGTLISGRKYWLANSRKVCAEFSHYETLGRFITAAFIPPGNLPIRTWAVSADGFIYLMEALTRELLPCEE